MVERNNNDCKFLQSKSHHLFIQWTYWGIIKSYLQLWYWYCLHMRDIENPELLFCNLSYISRRRISWFDNSDWIVQSLTKGNIKYAIQFLDILQVFSLLLHSKSRWRLAIKKLRGLTGCLMGVVQWKQSSEMERKTVVKEL